MAQDLTGQALKRIGVRLSATRTTLPRSGNQELRDWITDEGYDNGYSLVPMLVMPDRDDDLVQTNLVFHLLAKEMFLHSQTTEPLKVRVLQYGTLGMMIAQEPQLYWEFQETIDYLFINHAADARPFPMLKDEADRVKQLVWEMLAQGKGVAIHSSTRLTNHLEEWWSRDIITEVRETGKVIEVRKCQTDSN